MIRALIASLVPAIAFGHFYDCEKHLTPIRDDTESLQLMTQAVEQGEKLSSHCLEYVLKRNLIKTATYLISEYYPSTQIDTEVILKQVMAEVDRGHTQILYQALKKSRGHLWVNEVAPIVYVAQSPNDVFIKLKL